LTIRLAAALLAFSAIGLQACSPRGHEGVEARLNTGSEPQGQVSTATPGANALGTIGQAKAPNKEESAARRSPTPEVREARLPETNPPKPDTEPLEIDADPAQFVGASPGVLSARLGSPQQVRREPPAEIWQYRMPGCVLDLFLYPEKDGKSVTYLEARDLKARPMPAEGCLERLMRARLASKTG
jgi:hypothetical protein